MPDRSDPRRGWPSSGRPDDDAWGPSTAVYRQGGRPNAPTQDDGFARAFRPAAVPVPVPRPRDRGAQPDRGRGRDDDGWSSGPPRGTSAPNGAAAPSARGGSTRAPAPPTQSKERANRQMAAQIAELRQSTRVEERGWPWWAALGLLIVIAGIGGLVDTIGTTAARGGFNIGIVVASVAAILVVRRSHMFPIVIAPPIVYSLAAVFQLYLRSGGLHDKKVIYDAAANYLVYGFPAIAAATAAVLIIAGFRLIARR